MRKGFSIAEVVISIGIFSLLSVAIAWILITSLRSNAIVWDQLSTQNEARKVLQHVVDDVRRAEASSIGSYPISMASANELIFYANIDADSLRERVRFWLDGTTIKKGVIKPTGIPLTYATNTESIVTLADYVTNASLGVPLFLYYNESYSGTQAPLVQPTTSTDVHVVRVRVILEEDPTKTPVPFSAESVVHIRNLKSN